MFFPMKKARRASAASAAGSSLVRSLLLVLVFAACGWGFWVNSQRQIERLNMRGAIWDETQATNEEDMAALRSVAKLFHDQYGLAVRIQIRKPGEPLTAPQTDNKTIFIGVVPQTHESLIVVPALVRRAVPPTFLEDLKEHVLTPALIRGTYEMGIADALHRLWTKLGEAE